MRNIEVTMSRNSFVRLIRAILKDLHIEKIYKFKDYAFLHFSSRRDAQRALQLCKGDTSRLSFNWKLLSSWTASSSGSRFNQTEQLILNESNHPLIGLRFITDTFRYSVIDVCWATPQEFAPKKKTLSWVYWFSILFRHNWDHFL